MAKSILGVHYVTAVAGVPDSNLDFYMRLLGLRLVKIRVNFDDPASTYTTETVAATQLRSGSEQSPELEKEDCK